MFADKRFHYCIYDIASVRVCTSCGLRYAARMHRNSSMRGLTRKYDRRDDTIRSHDGYRLSRVRGRGTLRCSGYALT